jgi:hypothetical protein
MSARLDQNNFSREEAKALTSINLFSAFRVSARIILLLTEEKGSTKNLHAMKTRSKHLKLSAMKTEKKHILSRRRKEKH